MTSQTNTMPKNTKRSFKYFIGFINAKRMPDLPVILFIYNTLTILFCYDLIDKDPGRVPFIGMSFWTFPGVMGYYFYKTRRDRIELD